MLYAATPVDLEALYRARSHVFLYSVTAFLRDGEAALDVVQEGFAFALRSRDGFRGDASLQPWVWRSCSMPRAIGSGLSGASQHGGAGRTRRGSGCGG